MSTFKVVCFASLSCLSALTAAQRTQMVCCKPVEECSSTRIGGDVALSYDFFRSLPDGSWNGNTGALTSLNFAVGLPKEEYGLGVQVGGSYGLYDWSGRGSMATGNSKALQQQGFVTAGLFRMTPECDGVNAGLVYDMMFNKRLGVFGVNPFIAQLRGQLGYLIQGGNEIGVWASYDTQTSHRTSGAIPLTFRAISQVNLFWCHYFKNEAKLSLWAGTPYRRGLMFTDGRAGRYIIGMNFKAPLTRSLSIVGHGVYMAGRSSPVSKQFRNYAANICFGIDYSFGGTKAGQRPYLPLADNSNFMVDTNLNL